MHAGMCNDSTGTSSDSRRPNKNGTHTHARVYKAEFRKFLQVPPTAVSVGNGRAKILQEAKTCAHEHKPSNCRISENTAMCVLFGHTCTTKASNAIFPIYSIIHFACSHWYVGPCALVVDGPLRSLNHHSTPVKFSLPAGTQNPYMIGITCPTLGAWLDSTPKVPAIVIATTRPEGNTKQNVHSTPSPNSQATAGYRRARTRQLQKW